ncbi:hypothetical protein [Agrobacterium tumefaciens]|uniref:hypothetical protein n=1 Tax=Agrobacterium tumefaciens TaxID=358 RepID=UPI0012960970|nr:hypothetical protein [Agrobacterium tumefaciens]
MHSSTVNVKASRKTIKFQPAAGTIGADQVASRHIQYLTNRYNEIASADTSCVTKFNCGVTSKNVETNFRARWRSLAMKDFPRACEYPRADGRECACLFQPVAWEMKPELGGIRI